MKPEEIDRFYDALKDVNLGTMESLVRGYIEAGSAPILVLNEGLIGAMGRIGQEFKSGQIWAPEVLLAARNMNRGIELLRPLLLKDKVEPKGKMLIGTVKGDIHDIGKNLVRMMMTGAGYEVVDLGTDVSREKFLSAITEHRPDFLGLSALLTTTMLEMKEIIAAVRKTFPHAPRVLIGGAPVTQKFADTIGADGYGDTATAAVELARQLIEE